MISSGQMLVRRPAAQTIGRPHHPAPGGRHVRVRAIEAAQVGGGLRRREEVALGLVAVERDQRDELLLGLDAFGGDAQAERVGQTDDRRDDRGVAGIGAEAAHERTVDLHGVDREPLQVAERGVAGAEVVDRELHAERAHAC